MRRKELMSDISVRMNEWLAHVWLCIQEKDTVDMNEVEKALVLCSETAEDIKGCHMRGDILFYAFGLEYTDFTANPTTVVDADGNVVYEEVYGSMKHNLAWIWRELLETSTSCNLPTQTIEVIKLLRRSKEPEDEEEEEEEEEDEENEEENENDDGHGFWDGHWTDAMKAAAQAVSVLSSL
ncbi:hypothetical protein CPC08DRAFT_770051 [Agrocybe pediades]|nr:hypothetical protein CPC08DRAFT_770051 [Agrocybe pediades]